MSSNVNHHDIPPFSSKELFAAQSRTASGGCLVRGGVSCYSGGGSTVAPTVQQVQQRDGIALDTEADLQQITCVEVHHVETLNNAVRC